MLLRHCNNYKREWGFRNKSGGISARWRPNSGINCANRRKVTSFTPIFCAWSNALSSTCSKRS